MKLKIYLIGLLFSFPFFTIGQSTIYANYSSGSDGSGDGSSGNPYKTFHKCYSEASSGDIIDLTGTFDWSNTDETGDATSSGYTLSKNLTIQGQGVDATYVQAASSVASADRCIFTITDGYVITFENLTLRWGYVPSGSYVSGGITALSGAKINMTKCKMIENRIGGTGWGVSGAIASTSWDRVTHTFISCTFKDNQASGSGYVGGAIELHEGKAAVFENCTFDGNQAACNKAYSGYSLAAGAVFEYYRGSAAPDPYHYYTNCTFYNNTADAGAGALFSVTGGGDRDYLTNCTFTNNSVTTGGAGAIAAADPYSGSYVVKFYIENTIIANNTNESGSGDDIDGTEITVYDNGSNIVEFPVNGATFSSGSSITGNQSDLWGAGISIAPPPADNSTTNGTQTVAISTGSVAIDAGSNTQNGSVVIPGTDQRGVNRDANPDIGAYEFVQSSDITWDGSSSSDWNTGTNWDGGSVPTSGDDVIIANAGTAPIIGSGVQADCNNLTINSGATLTVASGGSLITTGTITNNGTVNVQRTISNGQWHLISSPVSNAVSGMFTGDFLQTWSEEDAWWYEVTGTGTTLTPVKGYGFWSNGSGSDTHTFSGIPNTGDQSISLTTSGSGGSYNRANLVGNPYPSSIDWSGLDDTYGAVNYYNGTGYVSWNNGNGSGSQYIPPTQGFFVVPSSSGTFSLGNANRVHNNATSYYKSTNNIINGVVLAASNGVYEDDLWIKFDQKATDDFDFAYDAPKFFTNVEGVSQLYSFNEESQFSIDVRPEAGIIPLGFRNDINGSYKIILKQIDQVSKIELEDTKLNIFHDLTQGAYSFDWQTTDSEERFILHLKATGTTNLEAQDAQVYSANGQVYVRMDEADSFNEIMIYDLTGKLIYQSQLSQQNLQSFNLNQLQGAYLVQLVSDKGTQVEKVILR